MYNNLLPSIQKSTDQIFIQMVENINRKISWFLGTDRNFFDWTKFSQISYFQLALVLIRFIYIQNHLDNGIVLGYLKIQQFIIIRSFVPVNETVTDFYCVLNFMDIKGPCSVFWNTVQFFILITSNTNDDRVGEKG